MLRPTPTRRNRWCGHRGLKLPGVVEFLSREKADIILLQEVDLNARRTRHLNIAREISQKLQLNYVFGREFQELPKAPAHRLRSTVRPHFLAGLYPIPALFDSTSNPISGAHIGSFPKSILSKRDSAAAWRWSAMPASRGEQSSLITCISRAEGMTGYESRSLRKPCRIQTDTARVRLFCWPGISIWTPQPGTLLQRSVKRSFRMPLQINTQQRHQIVSLKTGGPSIGFFRGDPFVPINHRSIARCRHPTTTLCRSLCI